MPKKNGGNAGTNTTEPKYVQNDWDKNCVMHALSKVLSVGTFELAKRIVDENIGGVTMIKQMENGSVVKKVLQELGFVSLMEGGAVWSKMKLLVQSHGLNKDEEGKALPVYTHSTSYGKPQFSTQKLAKFYAVYWRHKGKEDWTDKSVQPGLSDHAFTIIVSGSNIQVPKTNDPTFDQQHSPPQDNDFISVFRPPA